MQLGITKILDGIFVGDQFVAADFQFIFGNKVSHIIGWSLYPLDLNMQQQGVRHLNLYKTADQNCYPSFFEIRNAIQFIDDCREECLCCLIYSDRQSDAALALAPYLMATYKWNLDTSMNYLRRKVVIPDINEDLYGKMEKIAENIMASQGLTSLKNIEWKYEFLQSYQPSGYDQMIIINTVKNTLKNANPQEIAVYEQHKANKHNRRIQWYDRMARNSAQKVVSQFPRGSTPMKKTPKHFFGKTLVKRPSNYNDQIRRPWRGGTSLPKSQKEQQDLFVDDTDFITLKELSRVNLEDVSNKVKIRKRSALKQSRSEKNLGNSRLDNNHGHFGGSLIVGSQNCKKNNFLSINTMSAKDFLNNLKSLGKINLHA